jgi:hypothetical protein
METSGFSPSGKIGPELGRMTCATATRSTALRRLGPPRIRPLPLGCLGPDNHGAGIEPEGAQVPPPSRRCRSPLQALRSLEGSRRMSDTVKGLRACSRFKFREPPPQTSSHRAWRGRCNVADARRPSIRQMPPGRPTSAWSTDIAPFSPRLTIRPTVRTFPWGTMRALAYAPYTAKPNSERGILPPATA